MTLVPLSGSSLRDTFKMLLLTVQNKRGNFFSFCLCVQCALDGEGRGGGPPGRMEPFDSSVVVFEPLQSLSFVIHYGSK